MKLCEIVIPKVTLDMSDEVADVMIDVLKDKNRIIKNISASLELGQSNNKYTFIKDKEIVGFLSLKPDKSINGKLYSPVQL